MPVFARFLPEMLKETPFVLVDKRRFFYVFLSQNSCHRFGLIRHSIFPK